jgi:hypothetical protein
MRIIRHIVYAIFLNATHHANKLNINILPSFKEDGFAPVWVVGSIRPPDFFWYSCLKRRITALDYSRQEPQIIIDMKHRPIHIRVILKARHRRTIRVLRESIAKE